MVDRYRAARQVRKIIHLWMKNDNHFWGGKMIPQTFVMKASKAGLTLKLEAIKVGWVKQTTHFNP